MTAPNRCEYCGAYLDAGERCDCRDKVKIGSFESLTMEPEELRKIVEGQKLSETK